MSNAIVSRPGRLPRQIKNLGWIIRHAHEVESLGFGYAPAAYGDGVFVAQLTGGGCYTCHFASLTVFFRWLDRPSFSGLPLTITHAGPDKRTVSSSWIVGDARYRLAMDNCLVSHEARIACLLSGV